MNARASPSQPPSIPLVLHHPDLHRPISPPLSDQTSCNRSKQAEQQLDRSAANRYNRFMAKKGAAKRAWKLLKLALVWAIARKGGVFRRGLAPGLRLVPSFLESLRAAAAARPSDAISYGEREFSFDETPVFHFKVHRPRSMRLPHIPCINPPVADDDVDYDGIFFGRDERESWLRWDDGGAISTTKRRGEEEGRDAVVGGGAGHPPCGSSGSEISGEGATVEEGGAEEKSIDMEAEEFIAKFYEQMRLQRQISLLQYNEMLARSTG